MVVIAIVGILAAVAVPSYRDYVIRARLVEVINLFEAKKNWVAETHSLTGSYPSNQTICTGTACGTDYLTSMLINNVTLGGDPVGQLYGVFQNTGNSSIDGQLIHFQVKEVNDIYIWRCGIHTAQLGIVDKYLPSICSNDNSTDFP